MTPKQVLAQFSPVIISPLNKYVFDKSYNTENMTLITNPEKFETPLFLKNAITAVSCDVWIPHNYPQSLLVSDSPEQ